MGMEYRPSFRQYLWSGYWCGAPVTQTSADTPLLIRKLASDAEQAIFGKGKGKGKGKANDVPIAHELFHSVIDTAVAKLMHYRDIAPRATTINKLRNGNISKKFVAL